MRRSLGLALLLLATLSGVAAGACRDEEGPRRAADYLRQCRDVGGGCDPATSCSALLEGIRRGCAAAGGDAPNVCGLYVEDEDDGADDE